MKAIIAVTVVLAALVTYAIARNRRTPEAVCSHAVEVINRNRYTTGPWPEAEFRKQCVYQTSVIYEFAKASGRMAEWDLVVDCMFETTQPDQFERCR